MEIELFYIQTEDQSNNEVVLKLVPMPMNDTAHCFRSGRLVHKLAGVNEQHL